MTFGDMKYEVAMRLRRGVNSVTLDDDTVGELVNNALQFIYPKALQYDRSFYRKSSTFTTTTTISLPADFKDLEYVSVPTARSGMARILDNTEWEATIENTVIAPSSNNPACILNAANITISPSSTGVIYYIWSFAEITSNSFDLSLLGTPGTYPVIPWVFEEAVILLTLVLARQRHLLQPDLSPSEVQRRMALVNDQAKLFREALKPLNVWADDIPISALAVGEQPNMSAS